MRTGIVLLISSMCLAFSPPVLAQDFWEATGGPNKGAVWSIAIDNDDRIFALTDSGLYRSTDMAKNWVELDVETYGHYYSGPVSISPKGDVFVPNSALKGIWQSSDHGDTWTLRASNLWGATDFAFHPSGALFYKAGNGIYRSLDDGATWQYVSSLDGRCLASDASGNLYAVPDGCFRSTDGGASWLSWGRQTIGVLMCCEVYEVLVTRTGCIIAATDEIGVFTLTDTVGGWDPVGLPFHVHNASLAMDLSGNVFFASPIECGVLVTTEDFRSWTSVNAGLLDSSVVSLAVSPMGHLYAGTEGGAIYRTVSPTTSAKDPSKDLPALPFLHANYPNPFNPTTTIEYTLPQPGHVWLGVYNVLGEEVASLAEGNQSVGTFMTKWDASLMPSGIYFYRLIAGESIQTRKMVLMK